MSQGLAAALDLLAIAVLVYGVYYRHHRRRDMLLAFVGLNVGVFAVTVTLTDVGVATGVGLGLFGVLAIMRLRSSEMSQEEVAYYFASLAIGLIAGLQPGDGLLTGGLIALIVAVMFFADHPRFHRGYRQQQVTVDTVYPTEAQLVVRLEALLGGEVKRIVIKDTDLVRDQTVVDVRYRLPRDETEPQAPGQTPAALHALPRPTSSAR